MTSEHARPEASYPQTGARRGAPSPARRILPPAQRLAPPDPEPDPEAEAEADDGLLPPIAANIPLTLAQATSRPPVVGDPSWQRHGLCVRLDLPTGWFDDQGPDAVEHTGRALRVCAQCPVSRNCLDEQVATLAEDTSLRRRASSYRAPMIAGGVGPAELITLARARLRHNRRIRESRKEAS